MAAALGPDHLTGRIVLPQRNATERLGSDKRAGFLCSIFRSANHSVESYQDGSLHHEAIDQGRVGRAGYWGLPPFSDEFGWQWSFPAARLSKDSRSGKMRRHHVGEDLFAKFFRVAMKRSEITKNAVPHSLRHSFATHRLDSGEDIRTV